MSSFSYIFGITATIIRMSHSLHLFFVYYRTMNISVLSNFEIDKRLLQQKYKIYKIIFYFSMCFLYLYNINLDESILYYNSLINVICFIVILNMYLFSVKQQNQMLLQTLFIFLVFQILKKLFHLYLLDILFIFSNILILNEPISQLRIGITKNDEKYFDIDKSIVEISVNVAWLLYSLGYNIICFFINILISLFVRISVILGYEVVKGKIGKDTRIYSFLINFYFIRANLPDKIENNLL